MKTGMQLSWTRIALLGALAVLAGCKIIPKGTGTLPPTPTPTTSPGDLPTDGARHRVALLVPLSGPDAAVGRSLANATTQALLDTNAQNLRITSYDTFAGPAAAARKAIADGNRLILGPLNGADVAGISAITRPARVPIISYSSDPAVAAPDVFVMGTLPANTLGRAISHAREAGATRYAVMAPEDAAGRRWQAAFTNAIRDDGGTLVATQTYTRGNTSIIGAAQRLKARGGFDAVLIADTAHNAARAAPQLKRAGAVSPRIIGTDQWSGEAVIGQTPALRGAWFAAVPDVRFRQFADGYQSRFGARPYRIATLGYDSVLLTIRVAREWRSGTNFPVARLYDTGGFLGLDGPFRFSPSGQIQRALELREVRSGGVTVVSPAPERFDD